MVVLGFLRFFISSMWGVFFVFIVELFPASVTSLSFGWVSAVGTVGATISPFIRLATAQFTYFLMAILSLVGIILIRTLRETKGQPIRADILELEGKEDSQSNQENQEKPPSVISNEND